MVRIIVAAVVAVPVGWFAGLLVDRIPDARPLFTPRPKVPYPGELRHTTYLLIDVIVVALFVLAALKFERVALLVPYCFLFTVLVALSFIDIDTLRLPDRLVFPSLLASAVMLPVAAIALDDVRSLRYAALGAFIYFAFLFVAHLIYPPGMGFGDVKLSLLMGLYLGWLASTWVQTVTLLLYAMFIGFLLGSVAGIVVFIVRRRSSGYPFGPFLAFGAVVAILLSESLLQR
jgi:leader peptidase (prepilin peptidase) / N-methyltransferase